MLCIPGNIDIKISLEDDIIKTAFIDRAPAKVLNRDFFRGLEIDQLDKLYGKV